MFKEVARLLVKKSAGVSLLCAGLLALAALLGWAPAAVAGTSTAQVFTNYWKSNDSSARGFSISAIVSPNEANGVATITMTGPQIGSVPVVPDFNGVYSSGPLDVANRPVVGDLYSFRIHYDDNPAGDETVTASVTAVNEAFATQLTPTGGVSDTANPAFNWSAPSTLPYNGYTITLSHLDNTTGLVQGDRSEELAPDVSLPYNLGALTPLTNYFWSVFARDINDNTAETRTSFMLGANFTGKVTDLQGNGVAGAVVYANGVQVGTTLSDGTYMCGGLAAGSYTISFTTGPEAAVYYASYYNNRVAVNEADPLSLASGVVSTGINGVLGPWGAVSGSVYAVGAAPAGGAQVALYSTSNVLVSTVPAVTFPLTTSAGGSYGYFYLSLVPAGDYKLKFTAQGVGDVWLPVTVTAGMTNDTIYAPMYPVPVISSFDAPATSSTLAVSGISIVAANPSGVAGYLLTESPAAPSADAAGWSATSPTDYTFASGGIKTLYAWVKGTSGLVSAGVSKTIVIGPTVTLSTLDDQAVTNVQTLNVAGTVRTGSLASLTINGAAVSVRADGSFTFPVLLASGANSISVVATDNSGISLTVTRTVTLDASAPALSVSAPADNSVTTSASLTVTGTVASGSTVQVAVNGGTAQYATVNGTGFSANANLVTGMNTIEIIATDASSKKSYAKRTVTLVAGAPDLAVTSPAQDAKITQNSITIAGTVAAPNGATVKITANGTDYTPDATTGSFSQLVTFGTQTPGTAIYPVTVTATDGSGNTTTVQRNVVVVTGGKVGDCNNSGSVSAADLQYAINIVIKKAGYAYNNMCDVNMVSGVWTPDGKTTATDVQTLINVLIKKTGWTLP